MQKVKRLLSVFLVLAMLLGMMSLPADAADSGYKLAILKVQKFENAKDDGATFDPDTAPEIQETDHVDAGDIVVLTVGFENTSGSKVSVGGFQSKVFYDTDKISVFTGKNPFRRNPFQNSTELSDADGDYAWNMAGDGDPTKDFISTNGVGDAYELKNGGQLIFSRYAFQVKEDAGDADVYFRFDADAVDVIDQNRKSFTLDESAPRKLIIGNGSGEDPGDTDLTVTVSTESDEVTIPAEGEDPAETTFTAEVKDKDGNAVENPDVKWSIAPKEEGGEATGVAIDENGKVTVASDAAAGEFTVTATVGEGDSAKTGTATLTVKEGGETPPQGDLTVTVSTDNPEVTVPAEGEDPVETTFKAEVKDKDGNAVENPDVKWSIAPKEEGGEATGVAIDENGKVTVASNAEAGTFTVTATVTVGEGDDAQTGTGTATLTVKKDGGETPPEGDITVTVSTDNPELTVPNTGADPAETTFTAEVKDKDGKVVENPDVKWSIAPKDATGVTTSEKDGKFTVTVSPEASAGDFTVTATVTVGEGDDAQTGTGTATLTVKKDGGETPPEGDFTVTVSPESDEVTVPKTGEAPAETTFTAEVKDKDGNVVEKDVKWSIAPEAKGVAIGETDGKVTVASTAEAGTFTVTATVGTGDDAPTATATLTVNSGITFTPQKDTYPIGKESSFTASSDVPNAIWLLEDKDGQAVDTDEISINPKTGQVTITAKAQAGTYYTVAFVNGKQVGKKAFTISTDAEIAQMTVTGDKSSIEIPGVNDDPTSDAFKAYFTAKDKDGKPIIIRSDDWSFEVLNPPPETLKPESVDKETTQDGRLILTVKPDAKEEITNDNLAGSPVYGTTLRVTAKNGEDSASTTIVIRRADPALATVTLSQDTVTLTGSEQTVKASAFDQYGEYLASTDAEPITWEITSSGGSGVTIDQTGTVTVRANAIPATYTVQATRTVKGNTQTASAELKISKEPDVVTSIEVTKGPNQMEVPGKNEGTNDNADNKFVARVVSQHDTTMSDVDVQWSITDSSGMERPGITIQDGVVSIAYEAKSVISAGERPTFRVAARAEGVEGSTELYIVRAAPYLNDLSLDNEKIEIDGEQGGTAQCTALDQYEEPFDGDVTWSVTPYGGVSGNSGVKVDASSGLITVTGDATPGAYNVYANSNVGPKILLVSRKSSYTNKITISTDGDIVVNIPPDGQQTPETRQFSAKDQFNVSLPQSSVTWTITDAAEGGTTVQGVTIDSNGVVSVANEAKAQVGQYPSFKEMYVHAASGSSPATPFKLIVMRQSPELNKVRLDNTDSPDANGKTYTVKYTDGETKQVTAAALDQYGSNFSGASWDIESYTDEIGVKIDPSSGVITISNGAVSANYTVVASYNGKRVSAPFLIQKTASSSSSIGKVVVDPSSVTISNSSTAISQATAYDGNNNPITVGILWSVFPSGDGVSIARDGKITISSNASTRPYVITATPDNTFGVVSGNAQSADLIVQNISTAAGELDHIALTKSSVTVDGTTSETSTARALDKDNNDVSGVTWAIAPANGGVSIDSNGTVHIFKSATAGDYTITATKGAISKETKLTVVNETPPPAVSFQVVLTPETVVADGVSPASATASAVNASNQPISGVTWSLTPEGQGVSIDAASGSITVAASAVLGEYTVTASTETGTQSKTLRVSDKESETTQSLTGVSLSPAAVTLDGTNPQTVTATAQGTATDAVTWTVSPVGAGVSLNSASGASVQITVAADAKPGTYGVTATTQDGTSKSETLTVTVPAESLLSSVKVFPASAEVNGTDNKTVDANAYTSNNEGIASGIAWSVSPAGNGVTVDAITGKVTVDKNAMSGDYKIIATQGEDTRFDTLKVTNTAAKLTSVALAPASVELNGKDAATSTATAIGSGNTTLTTGVTWTVTPTDGGVMIDASGKITVMATAVSGEYLISAHYQLAVASATLTVTSYADIVYEEKAVDKTAVADTALASVNYADTGVKSVEHQASMMSAALAKDDVKKAVSEQTADTKTEVVVSVDIKLQSYDPDKPSMKLSVTPKYDIVKTADGQTTTTPGGTLSELPEAVKVTLNVPASFDATFAKHTHNNTTYLEPITYTGSGSERIAGWTQKYFSDVELTKDVVTIKFDAQGGIAIGEKYIAKGGTLSTLPTTARSGYTFSGWFLNNTQVTTSTVFDQDSTLVAQWTAASSGGGGGGGGGSSSGGGGGGGSSSSSSSSSSTYKITTSAGTGGTLTASDKKASKDDVITLTPTPKKGYELDTISVVTTSGKKEIALTETNGTYTFEMPKGNVTAKATFKKASTNSGSNTDTGNTGDSGNTDTGDINPTPYDPTPVNPTPSYTSVSFVDMQPDNFFYTAVQWAVERGITNGTTATTFSPNQACTRAQMVMFLWRSQGMPMPSNYNSPFRDVDPSANYYTAMMWAVERGITNGTTPTTFDPYAACTRAQMVMFLNRVAGRPRPTQWYCPFTDITVGENYYEPMLWALEKGITNGTTATTFSPYQACTRAQMVMFLYRYLGGR